MTNQNMTAWLEGISGNHRGMRFPLTKRDILIGRSQACDLRISVQNVSRQHAKIRFAEGKYYLQDQNSSLGTLLNGRPVQASVINDGDQITIGDAIFRFNLQQDAQPAQQVVRQEQRLTPQQQEDAVAQGAARAIAMNKSFVGKAWMSWAFYVFGVGILGLIFNIIYLREANKVQNISGQSPPGKGCLIYLLVVNLIGAAIALILIIATGGEFIEYLSW